MRAVGDIALGVDCARHARMFFYNADYDLEHAVPGTLAIAPHAEMLSILRSDYQSMANMIFGTIPPLDEIIETLQKLENRLNHSANLD